MNTNPCSVPVRHLEFFRGDLIRGSVGVLSTSQFISLFTGAAGIIILILRSKKSNA